MHGYDVAGEGAILDGALKYQPEQSVGVGNSAAS
jgi:hypothetical protein